MSDTTLDLDFEVTHDELPSKPQRGPGQMSKWEKLTTAAGRAYDEWATKPPAKRDKNPPSIVYPKDRSAAVSSSTLGTLNKKYGVNSEFHQKNGAYFEFRLEGRVRSGKGGSSQKGHLWTRKVIKAYEAPEKPAEEVAA